MALYELGYGKGISIVSKYVADQKGESSSLSMAFPKLLIGISR